MSFAFATKRKIINPYQVTEKVEAVHTLPIHMGLSLPAVLTWGIFGALLLGILWFFLWGSVPLNYGGDIAEYHGITESIVKSGSLWLTDVSAYNIATYLQPAYLHDPQYYILGIGNHRWPVHFVFYSILAVPVRLFLHIFQFNELNTLRVTNVLILGLMCFYVLKKYITQLPRRLLFLATVFLSPILWFISWPGPEIYYVSLLLLSIFFFAEKKYTLAIIASALASWQSQPLIVYTGALIVFQFISTLRRHTIEEQTYISFLPKQILISLALGFLAFIPYLYNVLVFGTLTPWTIIQNGWTAINGFGLQNISLQKFVEQLFDLDIGLFWYAPIIFIGGFIGLITSWKTDKRLVFLGIAALVTAFFYQTNPAWNYGTAGFGPTRHILFLLPFLIYFFLLFLAKLHDILQIIIVLLLIGTQAFILQFNGYLTPYLPNTLEHSPYATYALTHFPALYNPTPEIFVDRTNHTDLDYPTSAIYMVHGKCTKAYVLKSDQALVKAECGTIPASYSQQLDDDFTRVASYSRTTKTIEATFWPNPNSCDPIYFITPQTPYVCAKTKDAAMKAFGISDPNRLENLNNWTGVWKLKKGNVVSITVPPGYFIQHYTFTGVYVNY